MQDAKTFKVEDAQIIYRNFAGKEGQYNSAGDRNFAVIIDDLTANMMIEDGWNVKYLAPREEGDVPVPYVPVAVNFKNRPPRVVLIASGVQTNLSEDNVEILDWADIQKVDLICRGYEWATNGKSGVKAYLKSLFVTIEEDELERKYGVNKMAKLDS